MEPVPGSRKYLKDPEQSQEDLGLDPEEWEESWPRTSDLVCAYCHQDTSPHLGLPIQMSLQMEDRWTAVPTEPWEATPLFKPETRVVPYVGIERRLDFRTPLHGFLCEVCRGKASLGDEKLEFRSLETRGLTSKFMQSNFELLRFRDSFKREWRITDRLSLTRIGQPTYNEDYQLQQLALMMGFPSDKLLVYRRLPGTLERALAEILTQGMVNLIRNLWLDHAEFILPTPEEAQMVDWNHLWISLWDRISQILTIGLTLSHRYPNLKIELQKLLLTWNHNPFNWEGQKAMAHYLDLFPLCLWSDFSSQTCWSSYHRHVFMELSQDFVPPAEISVEEPEAWIPEAWAHPKVQEKVRGLLFFHLWNRYWLQHPSIKDTLNYLERVGQRVPSSELLKLGEEWRFLAQADPATQMEFLFPLITAKKPLITVVGRIEMVRKMWREWAKKKTQYQYLHQFYLTRNGKGEYLTVNKPHPQQLKIEELKTRLQHEGYPELDLEKGRPQMGWRECFHQGCGEKFPNAWELRTHLVSHKKDFQDGLHAYHQSLNLREDYFRTTGTTRCPSLICDQSTRVFTPAQLEEHFRALGITPFWKAGVSKPVRTHLYHEEGEKEEIDESKHDHEDLMKVMEVRECQLCYTRPCNISAVPCGCVYLCTECFTENQATHAQVLKKCFLCRQAVGSYTQLGLPVLLPESLGWLKK